MVGDARFILLVVSFFVGLLLYALSVYRLHMILREQKILSSYRLKSWSDTLFTQLVAFGKEKKKLGSLAS